MNWDQEISDIEEEIRWKKFLVKAAKTRLAIEQRIIDEEQKRIRHLQERRLYAKDCNRNH